MCFVNRWHCLRMRKCCWEKGRLQVFKEPVIWRNAFGTGMSKSAARRASNGKDPELYRENENLRETKKVEEEFENETVPTNR